MGERLIVSLICKMIYEQYNLKENWADEKCYEKAIEKQIKMIRNAYPTYKPGEDWVLWLIFDFYHDKAIEDLTCEIEIKRRGRDGFKVPYSIKRPYKDKHKYHAALVNSSCLKRIHGIPMVFHTFDELKEIESISVRWTGIEDYCMKKDVPLFVTFVATEVEYILDFKENKNNEKARIFSICATDYFSTITFEHRYKEELERYVSRYDFVMAGENIIEACKDTYESKVIDSEYYHEPLNGHSKREKNVVLGHQKLHYLSSRDIWKIKKFKGPFAEDNDMYGYTMYCKKQAVLTAMEMANFVPKHINGYKG